MPKTSTFHKCKYCENEAAKNIQPSGRFKGYLRTCGSVECLTMQYKDPNVNEKKRFKGKAICISCWEVYEPTSSRQKYCTKCAPDKKARRILTRYGLNANQHRDFIETTGGLCFICRRRPAIFVDHDHNTGKVRGLLCGHCNTAIPLIEDDETHQRAMEYLGKGGK